MGCNPVCDAPVTGSPHGEEIIVAVNEKAHLGVLH